MAKYSPLMKADNLILSVNSRLWCPRDQSWWDEECQESFDDLQFLAGCWTINLVKTPGHFADIYPAECKAYFDLLAKKRFNSSKEDKTTSGKKTKTSLEKKFEERKSDAKNSDRSDKELVKEVVEEMVEANKAAQLKELKKTWRPSHKPFFDKECQDAFRYI